jgi:heme/copper-type cytochrome/quinol oxidase subunit 1
VPLLVAGSLGLAAGSAAGLLLAAELARPGIGVFGVERYAEFLTGHDYALYLGVWPIGVAVALAGAALSPAGRMLGGLGALLVLAGAILVGVALDRSRLFAVGWTSYAPGTRPPSFHEVRLELDVGLALGLAGIICAAAPLAGRGGPLRAAGLASACIVPFPLATVLADAAGSTWEPSRHVAWYGAVLPFLGAVGESVGRLRLVRLYALSLAAFVPVAAAVWIEHAVRAPLGNGGWEDAALALPLAGALAAILVTLAFARPSLPVAFAACALVALAASGLAGAYAVASDPFDHVTDTQVVDAHLHLALAGFVLFALLGLAHARLPALDDRLGALELALLLAGTATLTIAEWLAGHGGMPRRVSDYAPPFAGDNLAAAVGGGLAAAAILVFLFDAARASRFPNPRLRS